MQTESLISCKQFKAATSYEYLGEGIDFELHAGEVVSIIGPNYYASSEWLSAIAGVGNALSGELALLDTAVDKLQREDWVKVRTALAFIKSDTAILSAANARQNVMLPAQYHGDEAPDLANRVSELLDQLQVIDQECLPAYLSPYQCNKVALARALILEPRALILDSPFERVDRISRQGLQNYLLSRVHEQQMALLTVTHDLDFALQHSNKLLFVTQEEVYIFDSTQAIKACTIPVVRQFLNRSAMPC